MNRKALSFATLLAGVSILTGSHAIAGDEIAKHGKDSPGWLGVTTQPVSPEIAKAFGLAGQPRGALVADVTPRSPAERNAINKGDIILELNGAPLSDSDEFRLRISTMAPGTAVKLRLLCDRQEREVTVTLGELPAQPRSEVSPAASAAPGQHLGISMGQLTPQFAQELGLPLETAGVLVTGVTPGGRGEKGGLRRGDVIQEVNRKPAGTVGQFQRNLQGAEDQPVLLLVNRSGDHLYTVVPAQ